MVFPVWPVFVGIFNDEIESDHQFAAVVSKEINF